MSLAQRIGALWKQGWVNIPHIMFIHVVTAPLMAIHLTYEYLYRNEKLPTEKYRMYYTVFRPDDPRVARIHHECRTDYAGPQWPKFPHFKYPLNKTGEQKATAYQ